MNDCHLDVSPVTILILIFNACNGQVKAEVEYASAV